MLRAALGLAVRAGSLGVGTRRSVGTRPHTRPSIGRGMALGAAEWSYGPLLELEQLDRNLFRTRDTGSLWHPPGSKGVYGGQVIGQALVAAHMTVGEAERAAGEELADGHQLHSMHAYFLRPGNASLPLLLKIHRLMDGRSFTSRSVTVIQDGEPVAQLQASFQVPESSPLDYDRPMPDVPGPDGLVSITDVLRAATDDVRVPPKMRAFLEHTLTQPFPLEVRHVDLDPADALGPLLDPPVNPAPRPARQLMWMRAHGEIGSSPHIHHCIAAWLSDWGLTTTPLLAAGLRLYSPQLAMIASLDHAMWFHRPFRVDEWMLYEMESDFAGGARGVTAGRIYGRDGSLKASVVQEGLIRIRPGVAIPPIA